MSIGQYVLRVEINFWRAKRKSMAYFVGSQYLWPSLISNDISSLGDPTNRCVGLRGFRYRYSQKLEEKIRGYLCSCVTKSSRVGTISLHFYGVEIECSKNLLVDECRGKRGGVV